MHQLVTEVRTHALEWVQVAGSRDLAAFLTRVREDLLAEHLPALGAFSWSPAGRVLERTPMVAEGCLLRQCEEWLRVKADELKRAVESAEAALRPRLAEPCCATLQAVPGRPEEPPEQAAEPIRLEAGPQPATPDWQQVPSAQAPWLSLLPARTVRPRLSRWFRARLGGLPGLPGAEGRRAEGPRPPWLTAGDGRRPRGPRTLPGRLPTPPGGVSGDRAVARNRAFPHCRTGPALP